MPNASPTSYFSPLPARSIATCRVSLAEPSLFSGRDSINRARKGLDRLYPVAAPLVCPVAARDESFAASPDGEPPPAFSSLRIFLIICLVSLPPGLHNVRLPSSPAAIASAYVWQTYPHDPQSN